MIEWRGNSAFRQSRFGVDSLQLGPSIPTSGTTDQTNSQGSIPANELSEPVDVQGTQGVDGAPSNWLDQFRAENSMLPNILIIGAMVIVLLLVMRALKRTTQKSRARDNALGTPSERIAELHKRAEETMEPGRKLMVEAEDIARRLGAALDNKAARLELLIEEADAKLDALNRAVAQSAPSRTVSPATPNPTEPQISNAGRTLDPSLLDRARVEQDQAERQTRSNHSPPLEQYHTPPASHPQKRSVSDQIRDLSEAGLSSREIADELKEPIGQVELILNLGKQGELRR